MPRAFALATAAFTWAFVSTNPLLTMTIAFAEFALVPVKTLATAKLIALTTDPPGFKLRPQGAVFPAAQPMLLIAEVT